MAEFFGHDYICKHYSSGFFMVMFYIQTDLEMVDCIGHTITIIICLLFAFLGCEINYWDYKKLYIDKSINYTFMLEKNGERQKVMDFFEIEDAVRKVYVTKELKNCRILITPTMAGFYEICFEDKGLVFRQIYQNFWFRKVKKTVSWSHLWLENNSVENILNDIRQLYNKKMFNIGYYMCSVDDLYL
ncbi:MAG: hypothetical protein SOW32_10850 [Agathobacter sp.]|nr:hypothetical protein [Agathobacter sp.]